LLFLLALSALAGCCAGCASLPPGSIRDPRDHFERFNRAMFKFDMALDRRVMRPIARTYVRATPTPVRTGISNFLGNLAYTTTVTNDILQGKPKDFLKDVARLIVNTTIGIGGFLDPATHLGLLKDDRDFGQTLGKWRLHTGSYLVLPLLGPSDVRDAFGTLADRFTTVDAYVDDTAATSGLFSMRALDTRANALPEDATLDSAFDPYAFVRSAWFQERAFKVHGDRPDELPNLPEPDSNTRK